MRDKLAEAKGGSDVQDREAARAFYTRISRVYDALAGRNEHRARKLGLALLGARPGERVLEIGFGTGTSLVSLAAALAPSGHVFGIDISPGMKTAAEQRLRSASSTAAVTLTVAAVPPIPFGDAAFDAVLMTFTLELFPDDTISMVVREVRRTLRPGGRFVVVSMALGTEEQRAGLPERIYRWMHRHFPHMVDCQPIDVERRLAECGFTVACAERLTIWGLPVVATVAA